MRIVVCLKEVVDTTVNSGYGQVSEDLMQKGSMHILNPNDAEAFSIALELKAHTPGTEVHLVTIGAKRVDSILREGMAAGADRAYRVEDNDFRPYSTFRKAQILASTISLWKADLILTGVRSLDNSSGLVGPMIAARLNIPFIYGASKLELESDSNSLVAVRNAGRSGQEKVRSVLPAVISVEGEGKKLPYPSMDRILESQESQIGLLSLADIGVVPEELRNEPILVTGYSFPRPRPKAAPLDSSLPAFYRILALLQGGIAKRRGQIFKGNNQELINQLYDLLVKEGVIIFSSTHGKLRPELEN